MKRCDPEGAVGRRQSGIQRLKASATSGPLAAAPTRHAVYLDHLLSTLDPILAAAALSRQTRRRAILTRVRPRLILVLIGLLALSVAAGCGTPAPTTLSPTTTTSLPATTTTTLSKAQITLEGMSLREKAAQVFLFSISGTDLSESTVELLDAGPPGGILLMGGNCQGADQIRSLTSALQETASRPGFTFGLIIAVDQEGGTVQRIKNGAPTIPSARSLGDDSTPVEAALIAENTAIALLGMGVNMNLAPVADVVSNDDSFLYSRTYSSDPAVTSSFVSAVTDAYQSAGLISVVKHFPGHGSATGDTHKGAVTSSADQATFTATHLPPFKAAIDTGVEGMMMSLVIANAYDRENPAFLSSAIVRGLARRTLGFQGIVLTDDLFMAAAQSEPSSKGVVESQAAVAALNAGCDLLILTETTARKKAAIDAVVTAVNEGTLSEGRLDNAVLRILELKARYEILAPAQTTRAPITSTTIISESAAP